MNRFLIFDSLHDLVGQVTQIVAAESRDRVTATAEHEYGEFSVGGFCMPDNRLLGTGQIVARYPGIEAKLNADTNKRAFGSVRGDISQSVRISGFAGSAPTIQDDINVVRIMPECKNAVYCSYHNPTVISHVGVGVKDNKSVCALCSYSTEDIDLALNGVLNDRGNRLKLAFVTRFALFGALKYDISMHQMLRVQVGAAFKWGKGALFGSLDMSKSILYAGGFTKLTEKLRGAANIKFNMKTREFEGDIGTCVRENAHLRARFGLDKDSIEWIASFSPRNWVNVSFRSITSVHGNRPVTYGWALDFHTHCEAK